MNMSHGNRDGFVYITDIRGRLGTVLNEEIVAKLNAAHEKLGNKPAGQFMVAPVPSPTASRYDPKGPESTIRFWPEPYLSFDFQDRHGDKTAYMRLVDTLAEVLGPQTYEGGFYTLDGSSYGVTEDGTAWIAFNAATGMIYDGPNDYVGMHSE